MRKIYENPDFTQVGFFQTILEEAGIPTYLKNVGSPGLSETPFLGDFPELWVVDEEDYDRALAALEPYYQAQAAATEAPPWICAACGAEVDGNFSECWRCQAARPAGAPSQGA